METTIVFADISCLCNFFVFFFSSLLAHTYFERAFSSLDVTQINKWLIAKEISLLQKCMSFINEDAISWFCNINQIGWGFLFKIQNAIET